MLHPIKAALYLAAIFSVLQASPLTARLVRAALDVGSGQTKMTVAAVDETTGRPTQVLFAEETPLLLGHDFKQSKNGRLSDNILLELENILTHYRTIATDLGTTEFVGVATAVFRESKNGADFINNMKDKLDLRLEVISQEEEGMMGFLSAVAASGKEAQNIIAWDSGGASFQITLSEGESVEVYKGPWGASKVQAAMVELQGKDFTKIQTVNPAKLEHVVALQQKIIKSLPPLSQKLKARLSNPAVDVVAIGGPYSAFKMVALTTHKQFFTKEDVWAQIEVLTGLTDEQLSQYPEKEMLIPRLTLIHTVMKHFDIPRVHYFQTVGSTLGILMSPQLWPVPVQ